MPTVAVVSLTPSALDHVVQKHIPLNRVVFDRNLSSTEDWALGGEYIHQYGVGVYPTASRTDSEPWRITGWSARALPDEAEDNDRWFEHTNPLVAAMQALVCSRLGPLVDVPAFLIPHP